MEIPISKQTIYHRWKTDFMKVEHRLTQFTNCKSDEDRVGFILRCLDTVPVSFDVIIENKSNTNSIQNRQEANLLYKKRHFDAALILYNQAIACATAKSHELATALGNRAAVFLAMKAPRLALEDIRVALDIPRVTEEYREKLKAREEQCLKDIAIINDSLVVKDLRRPGLSSTNDYFDSAAQSVVLSDSKDLGRHLISTDDINTADILIVEQSYASVILPTAVYSHCSYCLVRCPSLIPCDLCDAAMYCSMECLNNSLQHHRSVECLIQKSLVKWNFNKMDLLSLRILLNASNNGTDLVHLKDLIGLSDDNDVRYSSQDFLRIYHLVGNTESRTTEDLLSRTFTACLILRALQQTPSFRNTSNTMMIFAGGIILRFLQSLPCNAHEITDFVDGEAIEIGAGAFATLSLLNHSCDPNVVRKSFGTVTVARAIRPIKRGEEIVDNYGYHYATSPKNDRQKSLLWQYHFSCQCEACQNNWPQYHDISSSTPVFNVQVDKGLYEKLTACFKDQLDLVLKNEVSHETLDFLCSYLDFLDKYVDRPWQNYNNCQEAIKHGLHLCPDFVRKKSKEI